MAKVASAVSFKTNGKSVYAPHVADAIESSYKVGEVVMLEALPTGVVLGCIKGSRDKKTVFEHFTIHPIGGHWELTTDADHEFDAGTGEDKAYEQGVRNTASAVRLRISG